MNYLPTLQTLQKWRGEKPNLTLDAIVMVVDPNLPRASWPIGKVQKLLPSSDGRETRVRVAEVLIKRETICTSCQPVGIPHRDQR